MNDHTKNEPAKNDIIENITDKKYPAATYVEELGASTAEAICASMKAANDDAPSFGPSVLGPSITGLSSANHLDAEALAHALVQLRSHKFPAPFYKGKFLQKFRVIVGRQD